MARVLFVLLFCVLLSPSPLKAVPQRFEKAPHDYWKHPLKDNFSLWLEKVAKGEAEVPGGNEIEVMRGYFKIFGVPESSQMFVYSATSRQRVISPYRPRALYFSDDLYIGYVSGGRIEVASVDPEVGPVFRIFDFPRGGAKATINVDRSDRCMQCHAGHDNNQLPKLVIDSVIVNDAGGSLETWRTVKFGHDVPLAERFGGWHLTGGIRLPNNHANQIGKLREGKLDIRENLAGTLFRLENFPLPTSEALPMLLLDHQAGFVNLLTEAVYKVRELTAPDHGPLTPADEKELDLHAAGIVSYLLFQKEAKLPPTGVTGDPAYLKAFAENRRATADGLSLKDFDLKTRLFRHRCSYMIYTDQWAKLPPLVKDRCWKYLQRLLAEGGNGVASWIPGTERTAIRRILKATLPAEVPADWK